MGDALGWLGEIANALLQLIPRLLIVPPTHESVKWPNGGDPQLMTYQNGLFGTGIHVYWPVVTPHSVIPVKRKTANLAAQYLVTSDDRCVGVGGIVVYSVHDSVKLLSNCYDYEETITDHALAAIKQVVTGHTYDFFRDTPREADKELTETLRAQLKRFGVRTIKVTLSDFAPAKMVAIWGGLAT